MRDKDGVQAVLLFSMMKAYYKNKKITLTDKLELIYAEHGKFITNLYVYEKIDFNTISEKLFDNIKAFQISKIEDYERQKIFTQVDIKPFTKFPKTNLLKVYLKDNEWLAFRPSGTEAKFKIYTQAWGYDEKTLLKSQERVKQLLKSLSIQERYD
ncbi:MAG: hypothetical protein GX769_02325 [Erysipelothrix sp.]|nr:hypothetical protein [Erysipelothrix sp.]